MSTTTNTNTGTAQVDVRGPRFAAWVTTAVLIAVLVVSAVSSVAAAILLGLQAVVFAIRSAGRPAQSSLRADLRHVVAPRLSPVTEREPVPPLKFAQTRGPRVRRCRGRRLRPRGSSARCDRHCLRTFRRVPQRGVRYLPGLPALSAGGQTAPHSPHKPARHHRTERIPLHGSLRRPGLRRLGREQSRHPKVVFVEVDEDASAYDTGTSPVRSSWTGSRISRIRSSAISLTPSSFRSC